MTTGLNDYFAGGGSYEPRIEANEVAIAAKPNPNLFLNGGFDIAQRGGIVPKTSSADTYGLDQWITVGDRNSVKRVNFVDDAALVPAPATSVCQLYGHQGAWTGIAHRIESTNAAIAANQTVTLSGRAYTNDNTLLNLNTLRLWVSIPTARDDWSAVTGVIDDQILEVTDRNQEWVDFTYTFTVPDCRRGLSIQVATREATANNAAAWILFSDMKLEVGDKATEFERPRIEDELAKCQRYYVNSRYNLSSISSDYAPGMGVDWEDRIGMATNFPVIMRGVPNAETWTTKGVNTIQSYDYTLSKNVTGLHTTPIGFAPSIHDGGYDVGRAYVFHYWASAEL